MILDRSENIVSFIFAGRLCHSSLIVHGRYHTLRSHIPNFEIRCRFLHFLIGPPLLRRSRLHTFYSRRPDIDSAYLALFATVMLAFSATFCPYERFLGFVIRLIYAVRLLTSHWTGSFLPVTLEQLARERGVLYSDRSMPCVSDDSTTPGPSSSSPHVFGRADATAGNDDQCIISPFGHEITTASFAMYTFSLAVLVQCIVLISLGSFADYGGY